MFMFFKYIYKDLYKINKMQNNNNNAILILSGRIEEAFINRWKLTCLFASMHVNVAMEQKGKLYSNGCSIINFANDTFVELGRDA